jgi:hypothetical protein
MKQNPFLTILPFVAGLVLSYWTAGSSLFLNQQNYSNFVANCLIWPTVFVCMTFNSQPLGPCLDAIQPPGKKLLNAADWARGLDISGLKFV